MVGRNLCREHTGLWLPRIDARGEGPGITGMEFPLLNGIAGGLSCVGVDQITAARVLTLLFALLAMVALYALAAGALGGSAALLATAAFAFSPLIFYYGRSIQPDVPAVALALTALWLLERSVREEQTRWGLYLGSAATFALGILIKLPVVVFGLPAVLLLASRRSARTLVTRWGYGSYLPLALLPALIWYTHARALQDVYGIHYFNLGSRPAQLVQAWTSRVFYQRLFVQQLFDVFAFPLLSAAAAIGCFWGHFPAWMRGMAVATVAFFLLAGFAASHHFYYNVVAVPAVALLGAGTVEQVLERVSRTRGAWLERPALAALWVALIAYGLWRTRGWFPKAHAEEPYIAARRALDKDAPGAQVLVLSRGDPKLLWFLDRKGRIGSARHEVRWLAARAPKPRVVALDGARLDARTQAALAQELSQLGYTPSSRAEALQVWVVR